MTKNEKAGVRARCMRGTGQPPISQRKAYGGHRRDNISESETREIVRPVGMDGDCQAMGRRLQSLQPLRHLRDKIPPTRPRGRSLLISYKAAGPRLPTTYPHVGGIFHLTRR